MVNPALTRSLYIKSERLEKDPKTGLHTLLMQVYKLLGLIERFPSMHQKELQE